MHNILQTEVLVAGGGVGGFGAALAAARSGVKVLLIEKNKFLGGTLTAALVNPLQPSKVEGKFLNGSIFMELISRLKTKEGELFGQPYIVFDHAELKEVMHALLTEAGAEIRLNSKITGVILKKSRLAGVELGSQRIFSKVVVDASGDANLAYWAGVPCAKDKNLQPLTLMFRVGGVNKSSLPSREEIDRLFIEARLDIPREKLLWFEALKEDELWINTTRIAGDGTKEEDLKRAEVEGKTQMEILLKFLKNKIPGFENSYLAEAARQVGVRETRRIRGVYTLTAKDVLSGKKFKDQIALANFPIDIHNSKGRGTTWQPLPAGSYYGIPYRCLLPKKIKNLIMAGRPISVTHAAFSSARVAPTCMDLGQAAGAAAALAVKEKISLRKLEINKIRSIISSV